MEVAIHSLSVSRVHIACSNLGMAQRMLEISLKRANDRVTFGKPIASAPDDQGARSLTCR